MREFLSGLIFIGVPLAILLNGQILWMAYKEKMFWTWGNLCLNIFFIIVNIIVNFCGYAFYLAMK